MLSMSGKYQPHGVHRLVLLAFHGAAPDGWHACHADGDKTNNALDNLRWDTPAGNAADMRRHGRHRNGRKTHCKRGHEFTQENTYIQPGRGIRRCRACEVVHAAAHKVRRTSSPRVDRRAKLTPDAVLRMRDLRALGWTYQRIADEFGMSIAGTYNAVKGSNWRHVS